MNGFDVLLVDDEEEFVRALAERLEIRGFHCQVALCGEDALKMLREKLPDVIVLDLKMPGIGGLEVLRQVKLFYPAVQVVILTGHGSEQDRDAGQRLGAFQQLQKPVEIGELVRTMNEAYQQRTPG